jgi:glyoxylase-like metal-dependent hydrolase (beta-lactamase superfamily II)
MGRGRTDLGDGSEDVLMASIAKLLKYDNSITAYPGHNGKTTIGYEKINNSY